jgi:hypothetical protein
LYELGSSHGITTWHSTPGEEEGNCVSVLFSG